MATTPLPDPTARQPAPAVQGAPTPPRIDSAVLLRGASEVLIEHRGVLYRLRQTALGKLILTK